MKIDPKKEKRKLIKCYIISLIFAAIGILGIVGLIMYPSEHPAANICCIFATAWFTCTQIKDIISIIMAYTAIERFEYEIAQQQIKQGGQDDE